MLVTSVSKKSSFGQSELEKWAVSDCKKDYMLGIFAHFNVYNFRKLDKM